MELPSFENLDRRQKKLADLSIFLGKLLLAGIVFRGIIFLSPSTIGLQKGLAQLVSISLNLLGHSSTQTGIQILSEGNTYIISQDCLGWKSVAAFLGLSFASDNLDETKPVILGVAGILIINLVRIISTILLSDAGIVSFDFIHTIMWRWLLTASVFTAWIAILKKEEIGKRLR